MQRPFHSPEKEGGPAGGAVEGCTQGYRVASGQGHGQGAKGEMPAPLQAPSEAERPSGQSPPIRPLRMREASRTGPPETGTQPPGQTPGRKRWELVRAQPLLPGRPQPFLPAVFTEHQCWVGLTWGSQGSPHPYPTRSAELCSSELHMGKLRLGEAEQRACVHPHSKQGQDRAPFCPPPSPYLPTMLPRALGALRCGHHQIYIPRSKFWTSAACRPDSVIGTEEATANPFDGQF